MSVDGALTRWYESLRIEQVDLWKKCVEFLNHIRADRKIPKFVTMAAGMQAR
jgi:hypothetical protein